MTRIGPFIGAVAAVCLLAGLAKLAYDRRAEDQLYHRHDPIDPFPVMNSPEWSPYDRNPKPKETWGE